MPELPELTSLSHYLDQQLRGQSIEHAQLASFSALKTMQQLDSVQGHALSGVTRRGKFLELAFDGAPLVVLHLAKAGWLTLGEPISAKPLRPGGHLAARLTFTRSRLDITEAGTKKSVAIYVVDEPQQVPGIRALGPEPLDERFSKEQLAQLLAQRPGQLKGVLRDQRNIAGIGNAYSDEILHHARLSPFMLSNRLTQAQVDTLFSSLKAVLTKAVAQAEGKPAKQLKDAKWSALRVHGRTGQPCPVCGTAIAEVSFADRALQYCPSCQTGGRLLADRRMSRLLR